VNFGVGDTVKFVPDESDPLSFPWFRDKVATVIRVDSQPDDPYPYTIRFHYDKKEWPVKEAELVIFEGVN
jgi:hypothetical protein